MPLSQRKTPPTALIGASWTCFDSLESAQHFNHLTCPNFPGYWTGPAFLTRHPNDALGIMGADGKPIRPIPFHSGTPVRVQSLWCPAMEPTVPYINMALEETLNPTLAKAGQTVCMEGQIFPWYLD